MSQPKILALAGSTRSGSFNKKLLAVAVRAAEETGIAVTVIDLRDYPMPLYDGDLEKEKGIPENAMKLMQMFIEHDGLLIASPEYNSSISGVLKNTLDWISRPVKGMNPLAAFEGKIVGLLSASTGALGGMRGLVALRSMLGNIKCIVLPEQVSVSKAEQAFDEKGNLLDEKMHASVQKVVFRLSDTVRKLHAGPLKNSN